MCVDRLSIIPSSMPRTSGKTPDKPARSDSARATRHRQRAAAKLSQVSNASSISTPKKRGRLTKSKGSSNDSSSSSSNNTSQEPYEWSCEALPIERRNYFTQPRGVIASLPTLVPGQLIRIYTGSDYPYKPFWRKVQILEILPKDHITHSPLVLSGLPYGMSDRRLNSKSEIVGAKDTGFGKSR